MAGVPENAKLIYDFLIKQGASSNAAAGILGNIEQESGGNPNAGSNPPGKGLIQELGDPGGTVEQDLQRVMAYIKANGSIADINAHSQSPESAALYFSEKYERPGIPDNSNRIASASLVAKAAQSGKWPQSAGTSDTGDSSAPALGAIGGLTPIFEGLPGLEQFGSKAIAGLFTGEGQTVGDVATAIAGIGRDLGTAMHFLAVLGKPSFWLRIGAFFAGVISAGLGIYLLAKSMGASSPVPAVIPVPV
jgi:hypothetical protein